MLTQVPRTTEGAARAAADRTTACYTGHRGSAGNAGARYAGSVRTGARAGWTGIVAAVGLVSLGELAGLLLLGDPVTAQRLAVLAVAVLAVVAAGCVAAAARVDRAPAAVPVVRRVTALRDKSWRVAFLRLRDPGARGRPRPRAPSAAPAAA
jgi:hypothetical protein